MTETNHAISNAKGWLAEIVENTGHLAFYETSGDYENADSMREQIQDSVLSVRIRDEWRSPGDDEHEPAEYEILLSTGGPALRIYGQLEAHCQPGEFPELQWQDWGTPWTRYCDSTDEEDEAIRRFVSCFYFGD